MQAVLLFPVVIMIMVAFTFFLKKLKRYITRGTDNAVHVAHAQLLRVTSPSLDQEPILEHVPPVPAETSSPATAAPEKDVLVQRVQELEEETVKLKQKNMAMQEKNRKMKENIEAYHAKHKQARRAAGMKRSDAGTTRDVPAKNKRSGKPRGKKGGGYKVPSRIDRVVEWPLDTCPRCGAPLKGCKPLDHREHVIIDAKTLDRGTQIEHVKHVICRYRCPGCHQLVAKHFGKLNHAHYGLGLISLAMEERVARHGSWEEIRGTFVRFFHDPENLTSIPTIEAFLDWMEKWEPEIRVVYDAFVAAVRGTEFANVDETGLPMDGSNWWLWVVVTANVVLFKVSESRGHDTIKEMFEGYKGILISDFWSAYNKLSAEQQKCLAHLVKDLRVIAAEAGAKGEKGQKMLDACDAAVKAAMAGTTGPKRRGRQPKAPEPMTDEQHRAIEEDIARHAKAVRQAIRLHDFFCKAWENGDMGWKTPLDDRITIKEAMRRMRVLFAEIRAEGVATPDIERLLKRGEKFGRKLFTYLEHEGIPPDNNRAERAIRPFVVQRKVSGNFVNPFLTEIYAMLLSLYHTALNKKLKVRDVFRLLLEQDTDGLLQLLGLPVPQPAPPDPATTLLVNA